MSLPDAEVRQILKNVDRDYQLPPKAAEFGLRARVTARTETEEGPSPMIRLIFKTCGDAPLTSRCLVEEIRVHDVGGNFQVGDEFDVAFVLRPKSNDKPPY